MPEVPPTTTAVRPAKDWLNVRMTARRGFLRRERSARAAERYLCRLAPDSLRRQAVDEFQRGAKRAAFRFQNVNLAPKRTRRGPVAPSPGPSVFVTWPNVAVPKSRPGLAKCGVLVTLKASTRSSRAYRSLALIRFTTDASRFT